MVIEGTRCPICGFEEEQNNFEDGCGNCTPSYPGTVWKLQVEAQARYRRLRKSFLVCLSEQHGGAFAEKKLTEIEKADLTQEEMAYQPQEGGT